MMSAAIEVVMFAGVNGVSRQQMQAAAAAVTTSLQKLAGFVSRSFGVSADGRYVDIVYWHDQAAALSAAEQVMSLHDFRSFFALIEPGSVQMMHFEQG
jgi:hypothetical protein